MGKLFLKLKKKLYKPYKKVKGIHSKVMHDEIFKEAAALTFITVLSFIPFMMLIVFLIPDLPGFEIREAIQQLLVSVLLPESVEAVSEHVSTILDQRAPSNIFNVVLLVFTSFALFKFINGTFDKILHARDLPSNKLIYKVSKFAGMILFGFIFTFILFSSASVTLLTRLLDLPILRNISFILIPFLIFFIVNSFIYFFATTRKLKARSIFKGSVLASIIWIIAKSGFDVYIDNLTNMEVVFGVIATIPIFLFWIYLNWIIILLGVVIIAFLEEDVPTELSVINNN